MDVVHLIFEWNLKIAIATCLAQGQKAVRAAKNPSKKMTRTEQLTYDIED